MNALVGASAARVSSTPGRTRAINFFSILDPNQHQKKIFADLPGYGYAKISKSISAGWPAFIEPYLADRSTLALCVCLVDSNVPPQASDRQLLEWLRSAGRAFVVVATKVDRLSGNERTRNLAALKSASGSGRDSARFGKNRATASRNCGAESKKRAATERERGPRQQENRE